MMNPAYGNGHMMIGGVFGVIFGILAFILIMLVASVIFWWTYKAIIVDGCKCLGKKKK